MKIRLVLTILGALLITAALTLFFAARYELYVDRSLPQTATTVVIPRGSTLGEAALRLEKSGVAHALALRVLARLDPAEADAAAGAFVFPAHATAAETLAALHSGAHPAAVWVTIPEGYTAAQIAARLHDRGLGGVRDFAKYAAHTGIDFDGKRTPSLEGYLFPTTYLVPIDATAVSVAAMMTEQFRKELPPGASAVARKLGYTVPEVVTVASLIEREAKADVERPVMAGVYYHRLRIGMPLEVDATLEYAFAAHHSVITASDLRVNSPYNSYRHTGLPPTPIANPGRPSLLAAFAPQATPYLYYVYRGGGRHAFAATLEEHNANVARYLR